MDLHRLGIKLFTEGADGFPPVDLIPVFHRWIQTRAVEDLLIDVADYSHVHNGPGILLIAHEGNYAFDESDGRRGMVYYSKRPSGGDLPEKLAAAARKAIRAARRLAAERGLGELRFPGDEILIFSNDRLAAPNTEEGARTLEPAVRALGERLYGSYTLTRERAEDPRERLAFRIAAGGPLPIDSLGERLDA